MKTEPDLDHMSGLERILFVFDEAIKGETECAGESPTVCVLGFESYNSLVGALNASNTAVVDTGETLQYKGINIYVTHAAPDGLVMGHKPPQKTKVENQ